MGVKHLLTEKFKKYLISTYLFEKINRCERVITKEQKKV